MVIEGYPVGWAVGARSPEPFTVYLIDMPGCAAQGRTFQEAAYNLKSIVPGFLDLYRRDGVALPMASGEPTLQIGALRRISSLPAAFGSLSEPREDERVDLAPA
jgi:predicted RNase H-like HicB family nuclease